MSKAKIDAAVKPRKGNGQPKGVRLGGRQKGSQNKVTREARTAIELAFQGLGGVSALIKWAKGNQDSFYATVYPKLLPVQHRIGGDPDNQTPVKIIERRIVNADN